MGDWCLEKGQHCPQADTFPTCPNPSFVLPPCWASVPGCQFHRPHTDQCLSESKGDKGNEGKYFHSLPVFFWDLTVAVPCIYGDCSEPG